MAAKKINLPVFLYRLYGETDTLLYIGITENLGTRMDHHASTKAWWRSVARLTVDMLPDREAAEAAEGAAIRSENPRYNIAKRPSVELPEAPTGGVRLFDGEVTWERDGRNPSVKLAAEFRARLMVGEFAAGHPLPSMPQLASQYAISVTVVQAAWNILKAEGLIRVEAGRGAYPGERPRRILQQWVDDEDGLAYKLLKVAQVRPVGLVAEALGEDQVVLRQQVVLRGERPVELRSSYYPASVALGTPLCVKSRSRIEASTILADLGVPGRRLTDEVMARPPTSEEAELLDMPTGVPVLCQFRVVRSDGDRPIEASWFIKPGHLHALAYGRPVNAMPNLLPC